MSDRQKKGKASRKSVSWPLQSMKNMKIMIELTLKYQLLSVLQIPVKNIHLVYLKIYH